MKIRGNLDVLHDLVVRTAASDAQFGKLLTASSSTGKVIWRDLAVVKASDRTYFDKGSLATDDTMKLLYIANSNGAPGNDLNHARWTPISGEGSGGGGGVVIYPTKADLDASVGEDNIIYIVDETNSLYRWKSTEYIPIVGTQNTVTASVAVGGIKEADPVLAGTTLEAFINQLINPDIDAKIVNPQSYNFLVSNIFSKRVGTQLTLSYSENYYPGEVSGYDNTGNKVSYDLKSNTASYSHTPTSGSIYTIQETNNFTGTATYTAGTPTIYTSSGQVSSVDRSGGVLNDSYSFDGVYNIYIGMSVTDSVSIIQEIQNETLDPYYFSTIEYKPNTSKRTAVVLRAAKPSIYVAMPKGKFSSFTVKSSTFDTVLTEADFEQDFIINVGITPIDMELYSLDINGYSEDMNAELIIN